MNPFLLDLSALTQPRTVDSTIIVEEVRLGGKRLFHKGHRVTPADLESLAAAITERGKPLHAVHLDPADVHEDEAAGRLAAAIAGPGLELRPPVQSRVNIVSPRKGLLRVDQERLLALNTIPGVAIFTLLDRLPVLPGKIVAGAKITPVAIDRQALAEAERIAAGVPVVQVKPFLPHRVGVISTEGMAERVRDRFRANVTAKVEWFGSSVIRFEDLADDPGQVAAAIERFRQDGATLLMTGGGNTIDPLDPTLQALQHLDAGMVAFGAAAHPGSMFWLASLDGLPVFNLASCSMYSKATVADLVLPWIMAGEMPTAGEMASLGYGGLLDRDMAFRFPPYDRDQADDEQEE